jgi:hypothetical protein
VSPIVTMLPPDWSHGLPIRYRPQCVALLLLLMRLGADQAIGFFANVDSPSFATFWHQWPSIALSSAQRVGVRGDAVVATASMLQAALTKGDHRSSAKYRALLAQAAVWHCAATGGDRGLLHRGDVALRFLLEETSSATFDIHTEMIDLRPTAS